MLRIYIVASFAALLTTVIGKSSVEEQFEESIYPLLTRTVESQSCVLCHDSDGTSDLVFFGTADEDFKMLLANGYFESEGPDTLLGRVTASNAKRRMPKKAPAWTEEEIARLREFVSQVSPVAENVDEAFPEALLVDYEGAVPDALDNQFLTYRQLRAKVQTIFEDDWVRDGEDRFEQNVAMFGGADFKTRFNESTQPTSNFLTALDMMAREVVSKAYTSRTGPFAGHSNHGENVREEIGRLYEAILFRQPSAEEIEKALALFRQLESNATSIEKRDYDLVFDLTVSDAETGLVETRGLRIPVAADGAGVRQFLIDQSGKAENKLGETLIGNFDLEAGAASGRLVMWNGGSLGIVSFAGVRLKALHSDEVIEILADDERVKVDGAWNHNSRHKLVSYEDGGQSKGDSQIVVELTVETAGSYEVTLLWRSNPRNARNVLVEIHEQDGEIIHTAPHPAIIPAEAGASFTYDSSRDTSAFFPFSVAFQFSENDFIEIRNHATHDRVTAGPVEFLKDAEVAFNIDSREAEGNEAWIDFKSRSFRAYNRKGTPVEDENKAKGERFLRYRPKTKEAWDPNVFYKLRLYYPGKRDHESQVPVTVHALRSSPIVQLSYPARAYAGGAIAIDAGSSYTVQHSELTFEWKQLEGPPVAFDSRAETLTFTLPRWKPGQIAWQALARALVRHPDFLFTRPPTMQHLDKDHPDWKRLQLVKLALDLVGRPPNQSDWAGYAAGATIEEMADAYLASKEFEDFYFHRIRLYLESQGTGVQDEPARLWSYIVFNDLPFQQILTADFTVDANFEKQTRPAHHGKTGVLTTKGFIEGKPGLPHYNYAAQVSMLFLGYIYEVPAEIVEQREGITAAGTTDPQSTCYSCHKILTPLANQRNQWTDEGKFRLKDEDGILIDASDLGLVAEYPFKGIGMEAFATQAVKKERFIRTIIDTHFNFYFGRQMRFRQDERALYRRVWEAVHADDFKIKSLIRTLVTSPEYLTGQARPLLTESSTNVSP